MKGRHLVFLKDVLILTFSAFGGPQVHIALMLQMLVTKRKYLTEEEFIELNALCQMLPGPTSTQTITAIGFKRGGALLALLTLFIWALPAVTIMSAISFGYTYFKAQSISTEFLKYIQPMAVGFIGFAGYKIGKAVIKSPTGYIILILSTIITLLFQYPWVFPILLVLGGLITNFTSNEKPNFRFSKPNYKWYILIIFIGFFLLAAILGAITKSKPIILFENFYRFGSLIFGGGQVLIPMMYEQFVQHKQYLTSEEFLSGFGIVQGIPGPVFSFSSFAGGMALANQGLWYQLLGCVIGAVGIFLPGTLLIFFVYPFWEYLKKYTFIKRSLEGVNAAATGLVVAAAIILFSALNMNPVNIAIIVLTITLNLYKVPSPWLVLIALITGFIL